MGISSINNKFNIKNENVIDLNDNNNFDTKNNRNSNQIMNYTKNKKHSLSTKITNVLPNNLLISGYQLQDIVKQKSFLEAVCLLINLELPDEELLEKMKNITNLQIFCRKSINNSIYIYNIINFL